MESATGPLVCDFHALRFTFVASLDRADVPVRMAVQLARHSDPKLTISRYGKAQLGELSEAVSGLKAGDLLAPTLAPASTNLALASDGSKGCLMDSNGEKGKPLSPEVIESQGFEGERDNLMVNEGSAFSRARTVDPLIKRLLERFRKSMPVGTYVEVLRDVALNVALTEKKAS